jgi:O-acetyl-ADP-ribose deacetylase (regulator of RNase III)
LPAGNAAATSGGRLPAKYVIHTVGPIWHGGTHGEADTLASCYREALRVAEELGLGSVAFPSISTGAYGYPMEQAAQTAIATVMDALRGSQTVRKVRLVLFDEYAYVSYAGVARNRGRERGCEIEER